jgi:hypothetical protein
MLMLTVACPAIFTRLDCAAAFFLTQSNVCSPERKQAKTRQITTASSAASFSVFRTPESRISFVRSSF